MKKKLLLSLWAISFLLLPKTLLAEDYSDEEYWEAHCEGNQSAECDAYRAYLLEENRNTINELEERLRDNNIFNIGDVEYAILETSGQVTVIPKPSKRATIPEDFGIEPKYEGIPYDLVVDGKVMYKNLEKVGKNYIWLKKQTEKFGIKPEEALVVTLDAEGQFFCQPIEKE